MNKLEIMGIKNAGELFSSPDNIKSEYRELARQWHPDLETGDVEVMSHINDLYTSALEMCSGGKWISKNYIKVGIREFRYYSSFPFELGTVYVGDFYVSYFINKKYKNLYENALKAISGISYKTKNLENEFYRFMPHIADYFQTDDECVVTIRKLNEEFPLRDVLSFYKGKIPAEHVAWIMNRLFNIESFLYNSKLSHNAITIDNLFINPSSHTIHLYGGWFYSVPYKTKMIGMPSKCFLVLPPRVKCDRIATVETDQELLRQTGRELLTDSSSKYSKMKMFLQIPTKESPYFDFANWGTTIDDTFGERKFVVMDITKELLYKREEKLFE